MSRQTKLFGGEKEQLLQVIVDALITELEQARDRASS
jgi:hypothetical protein